MGAVLTVLLTAWVAAAPPVQADFSGKWTFDREKSMKPGPDGRVVVASIMGDEFVVTQSATTLTLAIKAGPLNVAAVYKLDGSESRNLSPGRPGDKDIPVSSHAEWDGDRLVIRSTSTSTEKGRAVTIETTRIVYLDGPDLVIERTGTPPDLVRWTRSVYRRAR